MQETPFSQTMIGALIIAIVAALVGVWVSSSGPSPRTVSIPPEAPRGEEPDADAAREAARGQQNNCINYGTARDMNCPAGQQDPTLSERQRYEARKKLEAEKIQNRNANDGCELGTHRVRYPQFNTSLCELNDSTAEEKAATAEEAQKTAERKAVAEKARRDLGPPTSEREFGSVVELLFATDRARKVQPFSIDFGSERSPTLTFGAVRVHVPEGHKIGKIDLPEMEWHWRTFTYERELTDPNKHFILKSVAILDREQWKTAAAAMGSKEALVFVHGYWNSFQSAAFRTAQIVYDLKYKGTAVFFSWPSHGDEPADALAYNWDYNSALFARAHFIELIDFLKKDTGIEKVHVVAHSMGNFVVLDALSNYSRTVDPKVIGQLIMAAPDVDRDQYRQIAGKVSRIVAGMTLYASSADKAMLFSRKLAQGPRAGDVIDGIPTIAEGIDAIDVTAIGDEILGMNHDTFAAKRSLINDIFLVLQGRSPPSDRLAEIRGVPEGVATPKFWRFAH